MKRPEVDAPDPVLGQLRLEQVGVLYVLLASATQVTTSQVIQSCALEG